MILHFLYISYLIHASTGVTYNINVETSAPIRTIPETFLSFGLDTSNLERADWYGLNFTFIKPLGRALAPANLRFGGTLADMAVFQENATVSEKRREKYNGYIPNFYYNGHQVEQIANFTRNVGWRLIWDLNLMLRSPDTAQGVWNSTNAKTLIDYFSARGYDNIDFELGNEPEWFSDHFNYSLTGAQIAEGYRDLRNLINTYSLYKNSKIIGPSIDSGRVKLEGNELKLMNDFLNNSGGNYVDALSFHFYYEAGVTAKLEDFLNTTLMDHYYTAMSSVIKLKNSFSSYQSLPVWAGETSSCYNGGAHNISNTYANSFLFLDKLGLSATHGLEVVVRQQLYDGNWSNGTNSNYSLINATMGPNPDYWTAFLFKKLLGSNVYNVSVNPPNSNLRLYAVSSKSNNGIIVYGVHVANESITIDFPQFSSRQATPYILKEGIPGNLQSFQNTLNGAILEWQSHQPKPNFNQAVSALLLEIPGYSQFFILVDENPTTQCPNGWYKESTNPNKCIKVLDKTQPLFGANFDCGVFGQKASILSVDSAFENAEVLKQIGSTSCNQFYIGLIRNQNSWVWSNNDSGTYTNWKTGYPTGDMTQNCITFDAASGSWTNVDCDMSQCYICQMLI